MKIFSIVLLVIAVLDLFLFFVVFEYNTEAAFRYLSAAGMLGVIGAYLLKRAKDKEKEQKERDKWGHGE